MKNHVFGMLIWSLAALALYFVANAIAWTPIISRHENPLSTICGVLAAILSAPFLWIPPKSALDGPQIFALLSLFWGVVFHGFHVLLRHLQRGSYASSSETETREP